MRLQPTSVVILGAGGHATEVRTYLDTNRSNEVFTFAGYLDDYRQTGGWFHGRILGGLGDVPCLFPAPDVWHFITAVGSNSVRLQMVERVRALSGDRAQPVTLVERSAWVGYDVKVGEGSCLAPGVVVTSHATIGKHCILNVRASVSHDSSIGDFVNINPGAVICGDVRLGDGVYVGAGAIVREKVCVGENTVIGAGAVVLRDLPANVTAAGVPARIVNHND